MAEKVRSSTQNTFYVGFESTKDSSRTFVIGKNTCKLRNIQNNFQTFLSFFVRIIFLVKLIVSPENPCKTIDLK